MTARTDRPVAAVPPNRPVPGRRGRIAASIGLVGALAAGAALLTLTPHGDPPAVPGRAGPAVVWPGVQQAELPGNLPDGPVYNPVYFLDARRSVGTAPAPEGEHLRLLLRAADGGIRELRRMNIDANSQFTAFTADGDLLAWAETAGGRTTLWTADLRTTAPARKLTDDTGNAIFFDSQYDMVIADGRLHWAAAAPGTKPVTEVRSVALGGGRVDVRAEPGTWALSAWPWLVNGIGDGTGTTRLLNLTTRRETTVPSTGNELVTCSAAWCRVVVVAGDGVARIDLMHPDGSGRVRAAGPAATAAITDVAVLDRFEVLAEAGPDADLTGTERLLVYDIASGRTADLAGAAQTAAYRGGVLWWSTGDQDTTLWHTIDLRTT